jgi:hypothetical protein
MRGEGKKEDGGGAAFGLVRGRRFEEGMQREGAGFEG